MHPDRYTPAGFHSDGRPDFEQRRIWDEHDRDDGLNAARGIVCGLIVAFVFWAVIAASVWIGWSRAEARHPACDGLTAAECTAYHQTR